MRHSRFILAAAVAATVAGTSALAQADDEFKVNGLPCNALCRAWLGVKLPAPAKSPGEKALKEHGSTARLVGRNSASTSHRSRKPTPEADAVAHRAPKPAPLKPEPDTKITEKAPAPTPTASVAEKAATPTETPVVDQAKAPADASPTVRDARPAEPKPEPTEPVVEAEKTPSPRPDPTPAPMESGSAPAVASANPTETVPAPVAGGSPSVAASPSPSEPLQPVVSPEARAETASVDHGPSPRAAAAPQVMIVLARPEVKGVADLRDKTVVVASAAAISSDQLRSSFAAAGAGGTRFEPGEAGDIKRVERGEADAAVVAVVAPEVSAGFQEIPGYRLLRVEVSASP